MEKKDYKYKFSIIMSIYNVEKWIEEAIKSIINQSIGFKKNVQLILINDGSLDDSEKICLKYKELYPNNIIYVKKKNGGLSSSRNMGIKYAEGRYINFIDPDDTFPLRTLNSVYDFFNKNDNVIDFVTIPLYFFEALSGLHSRYIDFPSDNKIINLIESPNHFVLTSAASFYKNSIIKKRKYDEKLQGSEDLKFNMELYKENPNFGYLAKEKYNYRKRYESNSIVDLSSKSISYFNNINIVLEGIFELSGELPKYVKEIIIYELKHRINQLYGQNFPQKIIKKIEEKYFKILMMVGEEFILTESRLALKLSEKLMFLSIMNNKNKINEFINIDQNGNIYYKNSLIQHISDFSLSIPNFDVNYELLEFSVICPFIEGIDIKVILTDKNKQIIFPKEDYSLNSPYDFKLGDEITLLKTYYFKFSIPIKKKDNYKFNIYYKNKTFPISNLKLSKYNKLILKSRWTGIRVCDFDVYIKNNSIIVSKGLPNFIKKILSISAILIKRKSLCFLRLLKGREKYILIGDRPNKGGDNGESIFKYINQVESELAKKTYYVISSKSDDYNRLKKYGKVVKKDSPKHKYLYLNSKLVMFSHTVQDFFCPFKSKQKLLYNDLLNYKFIWLQHGITMNDISRSSNKHIKNIRKLVTATTQETAEFLSKKYFYDKDDVLNIGFPRFDYLINNPQNVITVAPTWRAYLSRGINADGSHGKIPNFESSEYYLFYKDFFSSKKFNDLLEKNNFIVKFVVHQGLSQYYDLFKKLETKNIFIYKSEEIVYQKIFEESRLLVTDYSSIIFDFAFLKKPSILVQYDIDLFYSEHYKKGYFSYNKSAFGDISDTVEKTIELINEQFKNNFIINKKYLNRINKTFKYIDRNNCCRLYKEIEKEYYDN